MNNGVGSLTAWHARIEAVLALSWAGAMVVLVACWVVASLLERRFRGGRRFSGGPGGTK